MKTCTDPDSAWCSSALTEESIAQRINAGRAADTGPLTITFANSAYAPLLSNWLEHTRQVGIRPCIIALDEGVAALVQRDRADCYRMDVAAGLPDLWLRRTRLFAKLAGLGLDFIHSDVDALWLRNPVSTMTQMDADLVASQGTIWPPDIVQQWGFVLCCGLFSARGTPGVAAFFEQVAARRDDIERGDDQAAFNRALLANRIEWTVRSAPAGRGQWKGVNFDIYTEPVYGSFGGTTVAMLPYRFCPRLPEVPTGAALVAHPVAPKELDAKIALLERLGLWSPSV